MTQNEKTIRHMIRDLGRVRTSSALLKLRRKSKGWSPDTVHVVVFVDRARMDRATGCMPFVVCEVGPEGRTLDEGIVIEGDETYVVDELLEGYSTGPYTFEVRPWSGALHQYSRVAASNFSKSVDLIYRNIVRVYTTD